MKNSNFESLEKKDLLDKDINSDSASEKTEDEIIYNNNNFEEEEEYLDTERKTDLNILKTDETENLNNNQNINLKGSTAIKSNVNASINLEQIKSSKNKFHAYYSPKFEIGRRKHKKPEEVKTVDDLFIKALQKDSGLAPTIKEYDQKGNTMSTKLSDIIYDKYVGKNCLKENKIDIGKMRDEEENIKREELRTKDDPMKINDMINRQKDYEKKKNRKKNEREEKFNEKLSQECIFMPNGKNIVSMSRTPEEFYLNQIKYLDKKKMSVEKIEKKLKEENQIKKVALTSPTSKKIAKNKNPNESKEQFIERLYVEKLKNVKKTLEKPKEEKKMTKRQVNNLFNKLYKERFILKENKDKMQKEKIMRESIKDESISDSSNKVLLTKFLNYYEKILMDIFNRSDNFQINIDEYKIILNNMGCINPNLQSDEALIKESFFNILNPKDNKIDTYTLLLFCLSALGLYKGNDYSQSIKTNINKTIDTNHRPKKNEKKEAYRLSERRSAKPRAKTFNEIIKLNIPELDMNKYGFSSKIAKNINKKFHTFVKGINATWSRDITKKKQERQQKLENTQRKRSKASSHSKKRLKNEFENNEINYPMIPNGKTKNITISTNLNKHNDISQHLENKNKNLKILKNKKEQDELALCTFQPNISPEKNRNKLNKKQIDQNFEKLYLEGKASYLQKKQSIDPDPEDNLENKINCTFKPHIHQFKNEVFINNPIKEDIQKFEKIRDNKINEFGNKEYEKHMNFYIEPKINKGDIIDRVLPERISYNKNNCCREKEKEKEKDKENGVALLNVEVNLDENNNTDKIIIYPGDNVKEKTIQFCMKHKLSEEKKNTLLHIITEKIEETKNGEGNIIRQNYVEKSLQNKEFDDIEVENEENNVNQDNIENVEN